MKHEARTKAGARLVMWPRLNEERVQTSEIISEVLTDVPDSYEEGIFITEEAING